MSDIQTKELSKDDLVKLVMKRQEERDAALDALERISIICLEPYGVVDRILKVTNEALQSAREKEKQ